MHPAFPDQAGFPVQRERFLAAAAAAGARLQEYRHPLRGPCGEVLATDVAVLGDPEAPRVLVALSGTHGVEGFYGSDCQSRWLRELAGRPLPAGVAVVMVHLINPWGTAWGRRVNEDNIDLNRNYLDFSQPLPGNDAYAALHDIYACTQLDGPKRQRVDARLAELIGSRGWPALMSIVEAGQYRFPDGLFYGGRAPAWSNVTLHRILQEHVAHAQVAMCFDLHSGAGEYGHPMLMSITREAHPGLADARALYGPWLYTLLTGADSSNARVAATATGYTSQALVDALPHVHLLPFVIECGTYPEEDIHAYLRNDHWLHLHGDPGDCVGRRIKRELLEQFYPADPDWREVVWLRTRQVWERALAALPRIGRPEPAGQAC
ncbi:hypothetical protein D9M69_154720 [compost metagenome]